MAAATNRRYKARAGHPRVRRQYPFGMARRLSVIASPRCS
jgi:hypothetical protein